MEIEKYIVATDQQLIEFVLGGDSIAFEHLFNRYRDSIYQLYVQRTSGRTDDASDLLQETFVKVYLNMQRYDSRYTFGQWVYTIARNTFIAYMRRNLDQELSLERLADQAALSPSHYIRVFRRYTGQTPFAFLSDLRLREAAHCLEQGMTVSETALHVGLGNLSYFIRLFRQRYGQTPKQYQLGLTSRKK